ncbi:hypothetical protein DM02DRAFT_667935 [Periconia macrospinosa]|uniref:Uncharacterized protein n=1 Tax=Periconia macrospinosa TaxID=97972 RepID=A0A2V1E773_9PLEO|nr:hypothetical protein DM02DRAFT_667935 [Periconia macrospinosa]
MGIIVNSKLRKSSAQEKRALKLRLVTSYAGACARGNSLLYLPRTLRERIYTSTLTDTESKSPRFQDIEVPDIADITLPESCDVDSVFRNEITELLLENSTITITSDAAIYNLRVFLNNVDNGNGFNLVRSLSFSTLGVFVKGPFTANATSLVKKMKSLERVTIMVDLRDVFFFQSIKKEVVAELDIELFTGWFDIEGLLSAKALTTIVLTLQPYLALCKRIYELAGGKGEAGVEEGLSEFWGLKRWIEEKAAERGRIVEVCCPDSETVLGA